MSPTAVAFELVDGYDLATYGGSTHLRDGLSLNIGDALTEGQTDGNPRGVIVTDDDLLISSLDGRWDLRRAVVPPDAPITSHQLLRHDQDDPSVPRQHQRDLSDVPAIAFLTNRLSDNVAPPIPDAFPIPQSEVESAAAGGAGADTPTDGAGADTPTDGSGTGGTTAPDLTTAGPGSRTSPSSAGSGAAASPDTSPSGSSGKAAGAGSTTTSGS